MFRTFTGLLLLILTFPCVAQQPWSVGVNAHHGFLWPHRTTTWILVEHHAPALEVFAERSMNGDRSWQRDCLMPRYGFGLLYTGMGNPHRIGATLRLVPYLYLPFVRGAQHSFGIRLGWGIGYVAKPYDRRDNTQQIAIGTHINTAIQLMPEYRLEHGPWTWAAGIGIDHWSNGSFKLPNLGMNYLSVHVGAAHRIGPVPQAIAPDTCPTPRRGREWLIVAAVGMNESVRPFTGQHTVLSINGQVQWRTGVRSAFSAGADLFNKGSLATAHTELQGRGRLASTQAGLHGGYALLLGQGEIFLQMGAYVITPVEDDAPVFHRLGGRLRIGRHLMANIALKSHYAVADHWEFGFGYRWN